MSTRIVWDEHEQAVLLQALVDVLNHEIERKQAILEVSKRLREEAESRGIVIDEKFRNENGISLQMNCLEYAYTGGKTGLHVTRGWYFDIVNTYQNDQNVFVELLKGARIVAEASVNNKSTFQEWLEHTMSEKDSSTIIAELGVLEVLLKKNGVITKRILEIDDPNEASLLIDKIKSSKGIKIHSRSRRYLIISGLSKYKEFLEHKNFEEKVEEKNIHVNKSDFYLWLTEEKGLAAPTGRSYASAINRCDSLCSENNIGTGRIYGEVSLDKLKSNIELLTLDADFRAINEMQHNRLTAVLSKYLEFLRVEESGKAQGTNAVQGSEQEKVSQDELDRIRETLKLPRFEYGFKDDGVELYRFRASYEEVNGTDCPLDDDILIDSIRDIGFEFDGKIYLISDENMKAIVDEINDYDNQGINIIYYESLYDLKSYEYFDAKIVSADMLKDLLKYLMPRYRYKGNYFALTLERQTELELIRNDIIRVWGGNTLQTFDELALKLPLIPMEKIKFTLAQQSTFVWNSAETYMQAEWFDADEDEIERLADYIDEQCEEHRGVSLDEIPFDHLIEMNPEISEAALYTCFCKLVEDSFERNARMLTRKGASKNTYTAVIEFCRKQDKCTYEYLEYIAKQVAGTIRRPDIVEAANAVMVRVDKDDFIADRLIKFDTDRIDAALDYVVTDDFIGMREITTFSTFPFTGYGWNLYLLESYCRRFSKKYKYETRRANSSNSGAIVAKSCALNYHDIMTHAVARSDRKLQQDEVFDFLTQAGYMERKKYSDIDSLINEAAQLRERRK